MIIFLSIGKNNRIQNVISGFLTGDPEGFIQFLTRNAVDFPSGFVFHRQLVFQILCRTFHQDPERDFLIRIEKTENSFRDQRDLRNSFAVLLPE